MQRCYCRRRARGVAVLALWVAGIASGNTIIDFPAARYYVPELLSGNLTSQTGLWVSDAQDPLAYVYGYIPGSFGSGGVPYFASQNFAPIPVLLADPLMTLRELGWVLGGRSLPGGGDVLDLTADVAAWRAAGSILPLGNSGPVRQMGTTPEPTTVYLGVGGCGLILVLSFCTRKLPVDAAEVRDG